MRAAAAIFSLVVCVGAGLLYFLRPDWATALTILPPWLWLVFWLLALPVWKSKIFIVVTIAWLVFLITEVEETHSLLRWFIPPREAASSLVVTTVNCSGMAMALEDALRDSPDIVLAQESPGEDAIAELLKNRPGYQCLYGIDASIIVRGKIASVGPTPIFFTAGNAEIGGKDYFVASLRLLTSNPRVDLWRSEAWRTQKEMRQKQIAQIDEIIELLPDDVPLIVGGDFNVPQGDAVFFDLEERLNDSFDHGGRGWCNTIIADIPLLRIDQIWTSPELLCKDARARHCQATDHRLYTATFTQVTLARTS